MKRAQSALEFMVLIGGVLFFFITFLAALGLNLSTKTFEKQDAAVEDIALTIQNEIALATSSSDGYFRSFTLPTQAYDRSYAANLTQGGVVVTTLDHKHSTYLPVFNATGSVVIGANTIRRTQGLVFVNS